ncbi:hypothetical protein RhiirA1_423398 [Rhizophagus irregularis]|uniref:Uncharacterized protein n=1 Tax=Rhizophagus irregularis TaxID=588596 RepID=A0A2N0RHV6_9GLOM|nr:hypothetical protein RhiirA1_423398 [Rhizophagus irregularis]
MPTAVTHFKTNIYECLEALPKPTLDQLYKEPATCLAIFRSGFIFLNFDQFCGE